MHSLYNFQKAASVRLNQGFTLIEAMVSLMIALVTLTGIMTMNSQALKMVQSNRQSGAASLCLQERVEQLRLATWSQVTSSSFLRDGFLQIPVSSSAPLHGLIERVTVTEYPGTTGATPLVVEREDGVTRVISDNATLSSQTLARVDLRVTWEGDQNRIRVRESVAVIAKTGVSQLNLAMVGGGTLDGVPPAADAEATPEPDASPTPTPIEDPGASPTPTPTPTPTPGAVKENNGNGKKGRGHVGGGVGQG